MRQLLFSSIFFAVFGICSLGVPRGLHAENASGGNIKIGAIVDLTGPHATQGELNLCGMDDYFRYVNETAAGISGRKIELTVVDGGTGVSNALNDMEKFCISEKVHMATVWNADIFEKARPIFVKHRIPIMVASNCRTTLRPPVSYTYLPSGSIALDCYAILQYIQMTHEGSATPRIGILTANDACGKSIHGPSEAYASNHRLEIVAVEQFTPGTQDLKPAMLKLKDMDAEYIFMQCAPSDAVTALKSADRIQYNVPFFSPWTLMDTEFFNLGKSLIRNRINISFPGCLPGDGTSGINLIKILIDRYKSVSGFHTAYWEGVSIAAIMARALQRAHKTLGRIDGQTVNLALETFEREDFGELIPDITYTDTNHSASFVTRIVRVNENGTFTPLIKFWNPKTEKVTIIP